jgi:hypothetical protein
VLAVALKGALKGGFIENGANTEQKLDGKLRKA